MNRIYLLLLNFFLFASIFFFVNTPKALAINAQMGNYYFPGYESPPPGSQTGGDYETTCQGQISWSYACWNDGAVGSSACGTACRTGDAWHKYTFQGSFAWVLDPVWGLFCYPQIQLDSFSCSSGDKYNSGNPPVMNAGYCDCSVGNPYKTCCNGSTPVGANHGAIDNNPPDEAWCSPNSEVFCGFGSYPACGTAACQAAFGVPAPSSAPTGLTVTGQSCNSDSTVTANISWSGVSGATGYHVYIWNGSSWVQAVSTAATNATLGPLPPAAGQTWTVAAFNSGGEGPWAPNNGFTAQECRVSIEGIDVVMPGNQTIAPATSQIVSLDGGARTTQPSGSNNPAWSYWFTQLGGQNHSVSVSVPTAWGIGYTLCYNGNANCHNDSDPTYKGSSTSVGIPTLPGWADLWWKFYPPPRASITGDLNLQTNQTGTYNVTANDDNWLKWGRIYWSPRGQGNWNLMGSEEPLAGGNGSFSRTQAFSQTGQYDVVVNAGNDWGGHCTGNPVTPSTDVDCGANSRIVVTVGPPPSGLSTLNVNSTPVQGFSISSADYPGTTNYTLKGSAFNGILNAPSSQTIAGTPYNFSSWTGCSGGSGTQCIVNVSGGGTQTVTANYTGGPTTAPPTTAPPTGSPKAPPCKIPTPLAGSPNQGYGDVDGIDGTVDQNDANTILSAVAGNITLTQAQLNAGHITGSPNTTASSVTSVDAQQIKSYINNNISTFPVCPPPTPTPTNAPGATSAPTSPPPPSGPSSGYIDGTVFIDYNLNGVYDSADERCSLSTDYSCNYYGYKKYVSGFWFADSPCNDFGFGCTNTKHNGKYDGEPIMQVDDCVARGYSWDSTYNVCYIDSNHNGQRDGEPASYDSTSLQSLTSLGYTILQAPGFWWKDINGNGKYDPPEVGLPNTNFNLSTFRWEGVPVNISPSSLSGSSDTTDNGNYGFNVNFGTYNVSLPSVSGYFNTNSSSQVASVVAPPPANPPPPPPVVYVDFGIMKPYIKGKVYLDTNGNKVQDFGDPVCKGFLCQWEGFPTQIQANAWSDSNGNICYFTIPNSFWPVDQTLETNTNLCKSQGYTTYASISIWTTSSTFHYKESEYQGATVKLSGKSTASTTSGIDGSYSFGGLFTGNYAVTLTNPSGYTTSTSNPVSMALSSAATVDFGLVTANPPTCNGLTSNPPTLNGGGSSTLSVTCPTPGPGTPTPAPTLSYVWPTPIVSGTPAPTPGPGTPTPTPGNACGSVANVNAPSTTYSAPTNSCGVVCNTSVDVTSSGGGGGGGGTSTYSTNITVNPSTVLSGVVLVDSGDNNCASGSTSYTGGSTISIYPSGGGGSEGSGTSSTTNGTYSVTDTTSCGNKNVVISNISGGYTLKAVNPNGTGWTTSGITGYNYGPLNLSSNTTLNFCLSNIKPWFQTLSGDVRMPKVLDSVPLNKVASSHPSYPSVFFSTNWDSSFGLGTASSTGWNVNQEYSFEDNSKNRNGTMSYSFYQSRAKQKNVAINNLPCTTCDISNLATGIYQANQGNPGDIIINSYSQAPGAHVLILVNGNITINGNIPVPTGANNLLIIAAKGNITIDKSVGTDNHSSAIPAQIQAILTAEGSITVDGTSCTPTTDKRLNIEGALVANSLKPFTVEGTGAFIDKRSLCSDDALYPSVYVAPRLDFVTELTDFYKTPYTRWREVAP